MRSAVLAKCECRYEQEFAIRGGMATSHELCAIPCLCRDCERIVEATFYGTEGCSTVSTTGSFLFGPTERNLPRRTPSTR